MKLFQMKLLVAVCVALVLFSGKLFADDNRPIVIIDVNDVSFKYYNVKTFIRLEIPFMNLGFTIPVKGETRKIERINA